MKKRLQEIWFRLTHKKRDLYVAYQYIHKNGKLNQVVAGSCGIVLHQKRWKGFDIEGLSRIILQDLLDKGERNANNLMIINILDKNKI